ncbi:FAS1 domain-containing protein [Endogone sp. FLAS-F59071]|nr:FAS1 domain-containing protein [Endogone sp. FLAS-F59071]|eukprot:RUS18710.1 FAS1 domain-containing protein [Endogone sp. FLAS-F59071]
MLFKTTIALASMALAAFAQGSQNYTSIFDLLKAQTGQTDQLVTLLSAPQYSDLVSRLSSNGSNGTYTVFAPSDSAISKTVQALGQTYDFTNVILYHIANGTYTSSNLTNSSTILYTLLTNSSFDLFPNNVGVPLDVTNNGTAIQVLYGLNVANVTQAGLSAGNGVVYIIDAVLTPPLSPSQTVQQGGLSALYNALNSTNSTSTLDGKHGITIFAPIDKAFDAASLSGLNASQIQNIIGYHVVDGVYFSNNLTSTNGPLNLTTEQGSNLTVTHSGSTIQITDVSGNETAKVVKADIITDNGVIHIIDTVLIPSTNGTIPNGTNTNFTNNGSSHSGASSFRGADFSAMAVLVAAAAAAFTVLL